ncbi:hypothetical protein [Xanthomonas arboricola]
MLVGLAIYLAFRFERKFAAVASLTALFALLVIVAFLSLTGRDFCTRSSNRRWNNNDNGSCSRS